MPDVVRSANDPQATTSLRPKWSRRLGIISLTVVMIGWSLGILFAIGASYDFMWRAGDSGTPPTHWPKEISSPTIKDKPIVLVFLHPQCPCSRATLDELDIAMTHTRNQFQYVAVFEQPAGRGDDWTKADLWKKAEKIEGLTLLVDVDDKLVNAFQARTSGDTVVYSPEGELLFHGGLTPGRDHRGDNAGRLFLESWTANKPLKLVTSPVFGCPLCVATQAETTAPPRQENVSHAP